MFALHFSPTSRPILTSKDHALLALIVEERFTLPHVVANYEAAHPARQSLLTLTRWLKLPHIDTALKTLLADLREYESIRHEFLQRHSIDGLVDAMHSASRNLKLLEEARQHNIQHTRAVEELRLAAQALNRATKPGGTASRGTVPAPRGRAASESRSTDHSSAQRDSASSSPRSGARDEPGASAPGTETSHITLPSSFLSTEGASHSTRSPDALTSEITFSPSTPRHLDTSTPSSSPSTLPPASASHSANSCPNTSPTNLAVRSSHNCNSISLDRLRTIVIPDH